VGLLVAHARDLHQGEGASLGGEEEVLGHRASPYSVGASRI
jgi:hypothetical protein